MTSPLTQAVKKYVPIEGHNSLVTDSLMTEYLLDNCEIIFEPDNRFFCLTDIIEADCGNYYTLMERYENELNLIREEELDKVVETRAFVFKADFGHTTPNWSDVVSLGFVGLKKRAESYAAKTGNDAEKKRFFDALLRVYNASERFIKRVIEKAEETGRNKIAEGLKNLLINPPSNMFEAIQSLMLFYTLQHRMECTWIRSYGRVDKLLYPFYANENKEDVRLMAHDFVAELQCQNESANQPFALGGSDKDGNDLINELSYIFLEEYIKLSPPWVKIHLLISDKCPESFLRLALDGIRKGSNSLLFMGDTTIKKALKRLGIADEDIVDYHVDGCYECGGYGEVTCPAASNVNLAKALEYALNNGEDILKGCKAGLSVDKEPESFDEFYSEYLRQLKNLLDTCNYYLNKMEALFPKIHAGPLFSSSYENCLKEGKDIFNHFGAKYNSTSITCVGLGTTVDSLMAIKKLCFDDKIMTLKELNEILKNNWADNEALRVTIKNKFPKYGMGIPEVDFYAKDIVDFLGSEVNGSPNAKGGFFRLGLYSITTRWELGKHLAATPDGRFAGETVSLNSGASFGSDREGPLGHIHSVTAIDATNAPTAVILDLDLHSSVVKGENGLNVMLSTLKTYLQNGGFAVHYNVLNADVLRKAQKNPQDYPNLQVRLCGWNYLFNRLDKYEQDEYIMRAEVAE